MTILWAQTQPAPHVCDHTDNETQLQTIRNDLEVARQTPRAAGTDDELRQKLDKMRQDARKATQETRNLRTQLANALSLATCAGPIAPKQREDRGQKFPDSPDIAGSD
jgi:uncharacterized protein (DUF3084 family)